MEQEEDEPRESVLSVSSTVEDKINLLGVCTSVRNLLGVCTSVRNLNFSQGRCSSSSPTTKVLHGSGYSDSPLGAPTQC